MPFHLIKPNRTKAHQNIQNRLFALEEGDGNLLRGHNRAPALLMAAEGQGFGDVLVYYNHLLEHLRRKNLGHVLAGGNGAEFPPWLNAGASQTGKLLPCVSGNMSNGEKISRPAQCRR